MLLLGCLEVGSGWCFDALHVAGVENTIADGISRWEPEDIDGNLRAFRPDVAWHRQVVEPTGVAVCFGVLAATSSVCQLRRGLTELIRQVSGLGRLFGGLSGRLSILTPRSPTQIRYRVRSVVCVGGESNRYYSE